MSPEQERANVELILYRINELFSKTDNLVEKVGELDAKTDALVVDVAKLKIRSSLWGAVAGAASAAATGVIAWISTR